MRWMLSGVALLALAGCGAGASSTPQATPTTAPGPVVTIGVVEGTPAPEALTAFRCDPGPDGPWSAAGFVTNEGKNPVTYQVTAYVGPADGQPRAARTQEVADVPADGRTRFEITGIEAAGDTCRVQVLRTKG